MEICEFNPFIRFCEIIIKVAVFREPIRAYDCRVFYVLSGNGSFDTESGVYPVSAGSFLYLPAGLRYQLRYDAEPVFSALILNFDLTEQHRDRTAPMPPDVCPVFDESRLIPGPSEGPFSAPFLIHAPEISEDVKKIYAERSSGRPLCREYASALLKQLLIDALRRSEQPEGLEKRLPSLLREYAALHYREQITSESLRRDLNYHPYYLNRVFKEATGIPFHRYLVEYRIRAAQRLLTVTEMTVTEIAREVGFTSQTHFSAAFRRQTGLSPSEYRDRHGVRMP